MAKKTVTTCDGCEAPVDEASVETLTLGLPTGKRDEFFNLEFAAVHACTACAGSLTLEQLNIKLRNRAE